MHNSITNSETVAEEQHNHSSGNFHGENSQPFIFRKLQDGKYLAELFLGSVLLAFLLVLAESGGWQQFGLEHFIKYVLYINWVLLCFVALIGFLQKKLFHFSLAPFFLIGFFLLQLIILITTLGLNICAYWGSNLSLADISSVDITRNLPLHIGYGVFLGAFCFRYLYVRELWIRQQNSELQARVHALQARIHPHFLFNSLNNVISLITIDPDKAEKMLLNLSQLFRASLQELKLVPLQDEIDLCQKYLEIEKIRLGERLNVEWRFANETHFKVVQIPLLTLQPLLENSIFHGVEQILNKSTVSVLVEVLENQVNIVITNPFIMNSLAKRQSHGIATQNVKQRLEAYYGRDVNFRTFIGDGTYTTVIQYKNK